MSKNIFSKNNLLLINNKHESQIKYILDDIKKAKIYNLIGLKYKMSTEGFSPLCELIKNKKIDEIIYIDSDFTKEEKFEIWELTRIFAVRYRYLANSFDITKTNTELSLINEIPVLEIKSTSLSGWNLI
jgi:hypothetical protein